MNRRKFFKWAGLGVAGALSGFAFMTNRASAANRYYKGPVSDHFDGRIFFNPDGVPPGKFSDLLKWQFGESKAKWPSKWESSHGFAKPERRVGGADIRVTHVGHASTLIQTAGANILTDPVWSKRASPYQIAGPKRVNDPGIPFADLPPIDLVLLSHNHYDHLDLNTLRRLKADHDPLVVAPLGNDTIIHTDIPTMRVNTADWGDKLDINGLKIYLEPVHHWSARGMADRRMALWSGFVVEGPGGKIYHVGDTGFHGGRNYRDVRAKHGAIRLAILPFGAYEPRWFMKGQHQNPEEAVEGMELCGASHVAGHHWGTFQLTNEAIDAPREALYQALDDRGIDRDRFQAMLPGQIWNIPG